MFSNLLLSAMKIEKNPKTTYSLSYHLQNKKNQISRSLQKASELIEN
jgi:hypothetical protein